MLKDNKKACKKLHKYYKKEFKICEKSVLTCRPNYLLGLEMLMLYLQYLQDTILVTKSLEYNDKNSHNFAYINDALLCYSKYKQCILEYSACKNNKLLSEDKIKEQCDNILEKAKLNWEKLWIIISSTMEG